MAMFELKILSPESVPSALEKALRYRTLNEPEQAASICEDVLKIEPDNQEALIMLILAQTDRFGGPRPVAPREVRDLLSRLKGAYEREYYAGIIWEREAPSPASGTRWTASSAPRNCVRRPTTMRCCGGTVALV
jgi:hypothetical protein